MANKRTQRRTGSPYQNRESYGRFGQEGRQRYENDYNTGYGPIEDSNRNENQNYYENDYGFSGDYDYEENYNRDTDSNRNTYQGSYQNDARGYSDEFQGGRQYRGQGRAFSEMDRDEVRDIANRGGWADYDDSSYDYRGENSSDFGNTSYGRGSQYASGRGRSEPSNYFKSRRGGSSRNTDRGRNYY